MHCDEDNSNSNNSNSNNNNNNNNNNQLIAYNNYYMTKNNKIQIKHPLLSILHAKKRNFYVVNQLQQNYNNYHDSVVNSSQQQQQQQQSPPQSPPLSQSPYKVYERVLKELISLTFNDSKNNNTINKNINNNNNNDSMSTMAYQFKRNTNTENVWLANINSLRLYATNNQQQQQQHVTPIFLNNHQHLWAQTLLMVSSHPKLLQRMWVGWNPFV